MTTLSDFNLLSFKAISNFVNDLCSIFDTNHELKLYHRLLNKTTLSHTQAINKHIQAFKTFCIANRQAIISKDYKHLIEGKIHYSERVFIDVELFVKDADKHTINAIAKHLLTISAIIDPSANAREILKKNKSKESNLLTNIMDKVESNVDLTKSTNPLEAISSIMSSGVFNDIVSTMQTGMSDGSIDTMGLINTVQDMVGQLGLNTNGGMGSGGSSETGSSPAPSIPNIMQMIQQMMPPQQQLSASISTTPSINVDTVD